MMIDRFDIDNTKQVIEIASNDGYLLQYFHEQGIPVLGIEPAANVAEVAMKKGIDTRVMFFVRQIFILRHWSAHRYTSSDHSDIRENASPERHLFIDFAQSHTKSTESSPEAIRPVG